MCDLLGIIPQRILLGFFGKFSLAIILSISLKPSRKTLGKNKNIILSKNFSNFVLPKILKFYILIF